VFSVISVVKLFIGKQMAITLYIDSNTPSDNFVEAELRDMVLGYDRKVISLEEAAQRFGANISLPVLQDGERVAFGRADLMAFLADLRKFMEEWQLFQSDSCYIRADGKTC
jgi:hypothetical protein